MTDKRGNIDRTCFVPGCKTGYHTDKKAKKQAGESNPSLFKAPNDPEVLKEWNNAIPRGDKILGPNNVVCSLHFAEEDILDYYETKMPDGSINKIKRGRPTLKQGSVPSKCLNLPFHLPSSRKRHKPQGVQNESTEVKKKRSNPSKEPQSLNVIVEGEYSEENENEAAAGSFVSAANENTSDLFQCLKYNLDKILTPNGSWSGTFLSGKNEIIFAEWDEMYTTKKRIILHHDMSYKVLFGSAQVKIVGRDTIISDFCDLEDMIKLINKMRVCEGITTRTPDLCSGNLPERKPGQKGALTNYCEHCKLKLKLSL